MINSPGYEAFIFLLFRLAQNTAKIAPPTRQIPKMPNAMPDIQAEAQLFDAGSVLEKIRKMKYY